MLLQWEDPNLNLATNCDLCGLFIEARFPPTDSNSEERSGEGEQSEVERFWLNHGDDSGQNERDGVDVDGRDPPADENIVSVRGHGIVV